jgi:hypothetical protein
MSKQIQKQVPKRPKSQEPADAPTIDQAIARKWFSEGESR